MENGGGGVRLELHNVALHSMEIGSATKNKTAVIKFLQEYALKRGFSCRIIPFDKDAKSVEVELTGPGILINSLNAYEESTFDTALYAEPPKPENKPAVDALAEDIAAAARNTDGITTTIKRQPE